MSPHSSPSRVTLRIDDHVQSALPLVLRGDAATVMVADLPARRDDIHLVLDWECGSVTELGARIRREKISGRVVDLDLQTVGGAWQPFLDFLGAQTV